MYHIIHVTNTIQYIYVYIYLERMSITLTLMSICDTIYSDVEVAYDLWQLVLLPRYPLIQLWIDYCTTQTKLRSIPKDVWEQLLEFMREIKPDYSNYDIDGGAWPLIMDEFVEYAKSKNNTNKT